MTLTREQREAIEARLDAWDEARKVITDPGPIEFGARNDLIANAPADLRALLDALDAAEAKVAEGQEHIAYHLRDFRPQADMAATGDLAVDMVAYADRLKARAERAESERDEAVAKVARVEALAEEWGHDTWPHSLSTVHLLADLRAALDTPATDEGGEGA